MADSQPSPVGPTPDEEREIVQKFIEKEAGGGVLPSLNPSDFETLVSQRFEVEGPFEKVEVQLTLKSVVRLQAATERKIVRSDPFSIDWVGPAEPMIANQIYRLTPIEDPARSFLLYVKAIDQWPEEDKTFYETIIN